MFDTIYFTADMIRNARYLIKKSLEFQGYSVGSAHIAEAVAYSFGFNTNIAFETNMKESPCLAGDGIRVEKHFDGTRKFFERLNTLSKKEIAENDTYRNAFLIQVIESVFDNYGFSLDKKEFYKWITTNIVLPEYLIKHQKACILMIKDCFRTLCRDNGFITYNQLIQRVARIDNETSRICLQILYYMDRNFCSLILDKINAGMEISYGPYMANKYHEKAISLKNSTYKGYQTILLNQSDHWSLCKAMIQTILSFKSRGRIDFFIREDNDGTLSNSFHISYLINGVNIYKIYTFACPALRGNCIHENHFDYQLWENFRQSMSQYLGGDSRYSQEIRNESEIIELDSRLRVDLRNKPNVISVISSKM